MRILSLLLVLMLTLLGPLATPSSASPHLDSEVTYDPSSRELKVTATLQGLAVGATHFRLAPWLGIEDARIGQTKVIVEKSPQPGIWQLKDLAHTGADSQPLALTLALSGYIPPLDENARGARGAVASLEGSYLPGYAAWLPMFLPGPGFSGSTDGLTYRLKVTTLGGQTAVATGQLVSEQRNNRIHRAVFEALYPSELPSLFIGPYWVKEVAKDGLRIRTYFHDDIADAADHYLAASRSFIRRYEDLIGPYPFNDFHVASAPLPVGLGFPNLTYIGRQIVNLPFMRGRSLAHEVAHNWWGNGVFVDYAQGNWAEGLTTYMADYGLARDQGPTAAREMRLRWLRDFSALAATDLKTVRSFTSRTHQRSQIIGYNKVAHIFHMLENELGTEAFQAGIQTFWRDHQFKTAGWSDIQAVFQETSGRSLAWFFDQWLDRSDAPRIEIVSHDIGEVEGGHRFTLRLRQQAPAYRVTVPILVETGSKSVRSSVAFDGTEATFRETFATPPTRVRIDPDFDLFRALLPGESPPILRDVTLAPAARLMILENDAPFQQAAKHLAQRLVRNVTVASSSSSSSSGESGSDGTGPRLVIGKDAAIATYVRKVLDQDMPAAVLEGDAAAWVMRLPEGQGVLLIRGHDAATIRDLSRRLRHYGSRSYVTFNQGRASARGVWNVSASPLSIAIEVPAKD